METTERKDSRKPFSATDEEWRNWAIAAAFRHVSRPAWARDILNREAEKILEKLEERGSS